MTDHDDHDDEQIVEQVTLTLRNGDEQPIVRITREYGEIYPYSAGYPQADPTPAAGVPVVGWLLNAPAGYRVMDQNGDPTPDTFSLPATEIRVEMPVDDHLAFISRHVPTGLTNEAEILAEVEADLVQYLIENGAHL
ncbi:hypothetical protein SEA_DEXDERT_78 [Gordonia phage Dexdert]|uniref:Uncharacterized protein n=1 Tax=Gordonia phage Dexdert TaxID=2794946 RepID=A0A7T1KS66_9CAUD|nr:hypothetical protein J1597_gp78 [Gordonia phage Dexdert]QPO17074.1 hypothetical protein SEA_DEXDERT_78 [Gordonia phage Dexdert]